MFYRPNFCCHCGEKIVRARWTPLTSRRFCEFCEVEQKEHELVPKVGTAIAILIGAAGLTAYIGAGNSASNERRSDAAAVIQPLKQSANKPAAPAPTSGPAATPSETTRDARPADSVQREAPSNSSTEPVHYCGAITRKGTPCTRRVRSKGRCWQHADQSVVRETRD